MGIPESRLATWSNDGATGMAQETHHKIRRALDAYDWPAGRKPELYLQGSYRNNTTVRADSDVDLVAELTSIFYSNRHEVFTPSQIVYHDQAYPDVEYSWWDHKEHVLQALRDVYGDAVEPKTNAVKVAAGSGRLAADVVVSAQYRLHVPSLSPTVEPPYHLGITFWANGWQQVVNFPKQHYDNGAAKNSYLRTREQFKPLVRVFKNARRYMVANGLLARGTAPSYFIQCLLYNVPDDLFTETYRDAYFNIVSWLVDADLQSFVCQNGIASLFGDTPTHWNSYEAGNYIQGLVSLWNDWS